MFGKILVANRGEIACRIMETAQRLDIKTVAIYSDVDVDSKHVNMADESIRIGPGPSSESYLLIDRVLDAAGKMGVDAIHPGYGFLSENSHFAQQVCDAGLVFVGPSPASIAVMGDKIGSKQLAKEAGVNVIPGFLGEVSDSEHAVCLAEEIGFPVMIKASRGGGGKGMRVACDAETVKMALPLAQSEARTSFGDDRILIEKFIQEPRHIEIQVLADRYGNIVHLNERECSVQRRHQKVIEECPSPFVGAEMRALMGEQAIRLAQAVNYDSVGTVEFVVSPDKEFYFLEMNTRLQVEHPVTEMVCGLDLVEQMLRVAAGEALTIGQKDVLISGWAVEARLYAEDPAKGFLPATGVLETYREPNVVGCRVDSGVIEGDEVPIFYDPMIAKVVGYGPNRQKAIDILANSLDDFCIRGLPNNLVFLSALLKSDDFCSGDLSTGLISKIYPDGFQNRPLDDLEKRVLASAVVSMEVLEWGRRAQISGRMDGGRYIPPTDWVVTIGLEEVMLAAALNEDGVAVTGAGGVKDVVVTNWVPGQDVFKARSFQGEIVLQVEKSRGSYRLSGQGLMVNALVLPVRAAELMGGMPIKAVDHNGGRLVSPMPGKVVSVFVEEGQAVRIGDSLVIIDAMKMENLLCAESEGVIGAIHVSPGDSLSVEQIILEIKPTTDVESGSPDS